MAMGGRKLHVMRMVVGEGMKIAVIGVAIGTVFALPLPKLFESMFYDFPVAAAGLYVLVPVVLLLVAAVGYVSPGAIRRTSRPHSGPASGMNFLSFERRRNVRVREIIAFE
jgi:putative ABC transport system permease protein